MRGSHGRTSKGVVSEVDNSIINEKQYGVAKRAWGSRDLSNVDHDKLQLSESSADSDHGWDRAYSKVS
jgi:hypothetical protein